MKVCYIDESGYDLAKDPVLVMVGIVVDAQRMFRTKEEFAGIFDEIGSLFPDALRELKGTKIFNGLDRWRSVDATKRKSIIGDLCRWICERKHHLALAAIDQRRFASTEGAPAGVGTDCWIAGAIHIVLQLQRAHQGQRGNKGQTFVIFDENKRKVDSLPELLHSPPPWTDSYYGKGRRQEQLDQIVDSAFFAKSHHAGLTQVADVFGFVFRRYAELTDGHRSEAFAGELEAIEGFVETLRPRLLPRAHRWPPKSSACAAWYANVAPPSILSLG